MAVWLGISGPIASGKSTLATLLFMNIKGKVAVIPFAKALKDLVYNVQLRLIDPKNGMPSNRSLHYEHAVQYVYDFLTKHDRFVSIGGASHASEQIVDTIARVKDYRAVLQIVGTDIVRAQIRPEFWVNIVRRQLPLYDVVISDDVRFMNEAYAVHTHIRIDVSNEREKYAERLKQAVEEKGHGLPNHPSEHDLSDTADIYIPMSYSIIEVRRAIKQRHPEIVFDDVIY